MAYFQKLKITGDPINHNCRITLDGREVPNVKHLELQLGADEISLLTLKQYVEVEEVGETMTTVKDVTPIDNRGYREYARAGTIETRNIEDADGHTVYQGKEWLSRPDQLGNWLVVDSVTDKLMEVMVHYLMGANGDIPRFAGMFVDYPDLGIYDQSLAVFNQRGYLWSCTDTLPDEWEPIPEVKEFEGPPLEWDPDPRVEMDIEHYLEHCTHANPVLVPFPALPSVDLENTMREMREQLLRVQQELLFKALLGDISEASKWTTK